MSSAMLLPLGLAWPSVEDDACTFQPSAGQGPGLLLVAAAMAALVLWSGAALEARASRGAAPSPHIVAVRDPSPVDSVTVPSALALPAAVDDPPLGAPPSAPIPPPLAAASVDDALARERLWIGAARSALADAAHGRALAALDAHEQQFPRGALAWQRESLREEARSALRHTSRRRSPR